MGPSGYVIGAMGGALMLSGVALYFTGQAYLDQRDKTVRLEHASEINRLTQEHKEEKETALAELAETFNGKITDIESDNKETNIALTRQLAEARQDALQKPMAFGDDLIRGFIRLDCLWASGEAGNSVQGRAACSREAEASDPTSAGFSFAVITPGFLKNWGEACDDWPRTKIPAIAGEEDLSYTEDDWKTEYNNFDAALCYDSLVAMTPEFSTYLQQFISNGENYTAAWINYALEGDEIIEIITKMSAIQKKADTKKTE